jgi:hypothetical protein
MLRESEWAAERDYTKSAFAFDHIRPHCPTDAWISSARFAWVDLQAGPCQWGPTSGGEGVKSHLSTPRLEKIAARMKNFENVSKYFLEMHAAGQHYGAEVRTLFIYLFIYLFAALVLPPPPPPALNRGARSACYFHRAALPDDGLIRRARDMQGSPPPLTNKLNFPELHQKLSALENIIRRVKTSDVSDDEIRDSLILTGAGVRPV